MCALRFIVILLAIILSIYLSTLWLGILRTYISIPRLQKKSDFHFKTIYWTKYIIYIVFIFNEIIIFLFNEIGFLIHKKKCSYRIPVNLNKAQIIMNRQNEIEKRIVRSLYKIILKWFLAILVCTAHQFALFYRIHVIHSTVKQSLHAHQKYSVLIWNKIFLKKRLIYTIITIVHVKEYKFKLYKIHCVEERNYNSNFN